MSFKQYEPHLIYWVKSISGLDGFFSGKKVPIEERYFVFENGNIDRKARAYKIHKNVGTDDQEVYELITPATITYYLSIYGDDCHSKLFEVQNSLYGDIWVDYLQSKGLAFNSSTSIVTNEGFNITEFLPQAQITLKFNILIYTEENTNIIENLEITQEILDSNNTNITTEDITI